MASTKLNQNIRDSLRTEILQDRFSAEAKSLAQECAAFALRIYNDVYSKANRELMEGLPEGWLPNSRNIKVKIGDDVVTLSFDGSTADGKTPPHFRNILRDFVKQEDAVAKRFPERDEHRTLKVYDGGKIEKDHDALHAKVMDFHHRHREALLQIKAVLESVTTINKLCEVWPACEKWARKYENPANTLPAVRTGHLNKLLGIK